MWALLWACSGDPPDPPSNDAPAVVIPPPPVPTMPQPAPSPPEDPAVITEANCGDLTDGGPVAGPACITGTLSCGGTVAGHTKGGSQRFDTRFYEAKYCTPATTKHDSGDERVYALTMPPGDHRAIVTLDTPCADLDLAAMQVSGLDTCPTVDSDVPQCEMWPKPGHQRETVELTSRGPTTWLVVVEGKDDAEGSFGLSVRCTDGL
jgi:hypothetical protein